MFNPERMTFQPPQEEKPNEAKIESTRTYEASSAVIELRKTRIIFENQITPESRVCLIGDGQGMDTQQFLDMGVRPENIGSINYEQSEVDRANTENLKKNWV